VPALRTGSDPFRVYAAVLYIALVLIWLYLTAVTARFAWRGWSRLAQEPVRRAGPASRSHQISIIDENRGVGATLRRPEAASESG